MLRVWSRFQATRSDGTLVKLRIQELPKSRIDDAAELFIKYYTIEEKINKAAGIARNPQALADYLEIVTTMMKDPAHCYMICCEDLDGDKNGQIFGVSGMALVAVESETIKKTKPATKELQKFIDLLEEISLNKVMTELRVAHFYDDRGLIVHPKFRNLGIATEFLKARVLACVEHNVAATGGLTTSPGTQKVAEKENWETVQEVNLGEIGRRHGVPLDGFANLIIWKNPEFKQYDSK